VTNAGVQAALDECKRDLDGVTTAHGLVGPTSLVAQYLTRYALIKACGGIEVAYKAVVADYCSKRSKIQVKRYLDQKVRGSSSTPTYENMCRLLEDFDDGWNASFKEALKRTGDKEILVSACQSLVAARNDFAHGGSPTISLGDILTYFGRARRVVEELDAVIG
jgi:hypothetical protein